MSAATPDQELRDRIRDLARTGDSAAMVAWALLQLADAISPPGAASLSGTLEEYLR